MDLDEMMNTVLAQVRRVVDYDICLITLAKASGDTIRIEAADGVSTQSLLGIELPADQGINAWIYREGVPLLIGDAGVDPRRLHIDKVSERMWAAIGAPLIADDQPIGTIYPARYEPYTFTEEDLDFPAITATQDERGEPFSVRLAEIQRLTAYVIRSGQPLLIRNWEVEWHALPVESLLVGDPTQSWLGVPMIVQDQVVGAIGAQSYQPHAFTARHMRLLSAIANQAGISLQNAKLLANFQLLSTDLQKVVNAQAHLLRTIEEMIPDLGLQGENQASPRLPEEATHG